MHLTDHSLDLQGRIIGWSPSVAPENRGADQDHLKIHHLLTALIRFREGLSPVERQILTTYFLQLCQNRHLQTQHRLTNYVFAKHHSNVRQPLKILLCVQDICLETAYVLLSEIVDIIYFLSPQALVKWAGLSPASINQANSKPKPGKS